MKSPSDGSAAHPGGAGTGAVAEGDSRAEAPTLASWQERWSRADYRPPWRRADVAPELRRIVEHGWFTAGSRLLDIGCGDGWNALYLARRGFDVTGIDFAPAAVRRAEHRAAGGGGRLRFAQRDACRDDLGAACFESLLDVGCFQSLNHAEENGYARRVAAAAAAGARFLLLAPVFRPGIDEHDPRARARELLDRVTTALADAFEIREVEMPARSLPPDGGNLRLVVKMVRNG